MGCDPKSVELAEHFLQDAHYSDAETRNRDVQSLAEAIQSAAEDWLNWQEAEHQRFQQATAEGYDDAG